jgi:predicted dinucleotide-binding enzyme
VVKAFNAIVWTRLRDDGRPAGDPERLGIPISGDDEQAKQTVAELIDGIGSDAVDAGTLAAGGRSINQEHPRRRKAFPPQNCAPALTRRPTEQHHPKRQSA